MDLRESMRDSVKVFHEGLRVQLVVKLFCLETFMAAIWYTQGKCEMQTTNMHIFYCNSS